jgi:1-acyl-sn-glycerol-3-phosphate acyltransferase
MLASSAKQQPKPRKSRQWRLAYKANPVRYRIMKWIIARLMRLAYHYRVEGQENIPLSGALIIAPNHLHYVDPGAVAPAIPRQIVTLAADKYESHWFFSNFLRLAGVIFVRRGEVDRDALRASLDVLSNGGVLAVAPEGTRSKTGTLQIGKPGIIYLAQRTDAAILPIAIAGTEQLKGWLRLKRPTCHVIIGKPFKLPPVAGKLTPEQMQEWADQIMIHIGLLLPASYRGVYAERVAAVEAGRERLELGAG